MIHRVALHAGDRAELLPLFRLADDSEVAIAGYLALGDVLVARVGTAIVGHVQVVGGGATSELTSLAVVDTPRARRAAGYPPDLRIDGIPLRDRVWLDLDLPRRRSCS